MLLPAGRARLTEPMKVEVFADGVSLACYLYLALRFVFPFCDSRFAVTAIQSSAGRYAFQFSEKMIVRSAILVHENPAWVRCVLPACFEQVHQLSRQFHCPRFMVFDGEARIFLRSDMIETLCKIDVAPCSQRDFFVSTRRAKKNL